MATATAAASAPSASSASYLAPLGAPYQLVPPTRLLSKTLGPADFRPQPSALATEWGGLPPPENILNERVVRNGYSDPELVSDEVAVTLRHAVTEGVVPELARCITGHAERILALADQVSMTQVALAAAPVSATLAREPLVQEMSSVSAMKSFMDDLARSAPLHTLRRPIQCNLKKPYPFDELSARNVPIFRALWFVRAILGFEASKKGEQEALSSVTSRLLGHLAESINSYSDVFTRARKTGISPYRSEGTPAVMDYYENGAFFAGGSYAAGGMPQSQALPVAQSGDSTSLSEKQAACFNWWYSFSLFSAMYAEGLVDRAACIERMADWLRTLDLRRIPLVTPICIQMVQDTATCARRTRAMLLAAAYRAAEIRVLLSSGDGFVNDGEPDISVDMGADAAIAGDWRRQYGEVFASLVQFSRSLVLLSEDAFCCGQAPWISWIETLVLPNRSVEKALGRAGGESASKQVLPLLRTKLERWRRRARVTRGLQESHLRKQQRVLDEASMGTDSRVQMQANEESRPPVTPGLVGSRKGIALANLLARLDMLSSGLSLASWSCKSVLELFRCPGEMRGTQFRFGRVRGVSSNLEQDVELMHGGAGVTKYLWAVCQDIIHSMGSPASAIKFICCWAVGRGGLRRLHLCACLIETLLGELGVEMLKHVQGSVTELLDSFDEAEEMAGEHLAAWEDAFRRAGRDATRSDSLGLIGDMEQKGNLSVAQDFYAQQLIKCVEGRLVVTRRVCCSHITSAAMLWGREVSVIARDMAHGRIHVSGVDDELGVTVERSGDDSMDVFCSARLCTSSGKLSSHPCRDGCRQARLLTMACTAFSAVDLANILIDRKYFSQDHYVRSLIGRGRLRPGSAATFFLCHLATVTPHDRNQRRMAAEDLHSRLTLAEKRPNAKRNAPLAAPVPVNFLPALLQSSLFNGQAIISDIMKASERVLTELSRLPSTQRSGGVPMETEDESRSCNMGGAAEIGWDEGRRRFEQGLDQILGLLAGLSRHDLSIVGKAIGDKALQWQDAQFMTPLQVLFVCRLLCVASQTSMVSFLLDFLTRLSACGMAVGGVDEPLRSEPFDDHSSLTGEGSHAAIMLESDAALVASLLLQRYSLICLGDARFRSRCMELFRSMHSEGRWQQFSVSFGFPMDYDKDSNREPSHTGPPESDAMDSETGLDSADELGNVVLSLAASLSPWTLSQYVDDLQKLVEGLSGDSLDVVARALIRSVAVVEANRRTSLESGAIFPGDCGCLPASCLIASLGPTLALKIGHVIADELLSVSCETIEGALAALPSGGSLLAGSMRGATSAACEAALVAAVFGTPLRAAGSWTPPLLDSLVDLVWHCAACVDALDSEMLTQLKARTFAALERLSADDVPLQWLRLLTRLCCMLSVSVTISGSSVAAAWTERILMIMNKGDVAEPLLEPGSGNEGTTDDVDVSIGEALLDILGTFVLPDASPTGAPTAAAVAATDVVRLRELSCTFVQGPLRRRCLCMLEPTLAPCEIPEVTTMADEDSSETSADQAGPAERRRGAEVRRHRPWHLLGGQRIADPLSLSRFHARRVIRPARLASIDEASRAVLRSMDPPPGRWDATAGTPKFQVAVGGDDLKVGDGTADPSSLVVVLWAVSAGVNGAAISMPGCKYHRSSENVNCTSTCEGRVTRHRMRRVSPAHGDAKRERWPPWSRAAGRYSSSGYRLSGGRASATDAAGPGRHSRRDNRRGGLGRAGASHC